MRGSRRAAGAALVAATVLAGCEPYRIEYHDRPSFIASASEQPLPDRVTLPDGTVIVYRDRKHEGALQQQSRGAQGDPFQYREEREDGSIVLRCVLPEHVLLNTLGCLQNQEYDLVWEQMLAEETRLAYEGSGRTREDFTKFFRTHRRELARTMNRMFHGLSRNEVVTDRLRPGVIRYRFVPQIARDFKFQAVTIASERGFLKLLLVD